MNFKTQYVLWHKTVFEKVFLRWKIGSRDPFPAEKRKEKSGSFP